MHDVLYPFGDIADYSTARQRGTAKVMMVNHRLGKEELSHCHLAFGGTQSPKDNTTRYKNGHAKRDACRTRPVSSKRRASKSEQKAPREWPTSKEAR